VGTTPVYIKNSPALRNVQEKCCYIPIGIYETTSDSELTNKIKQRYRNRKIVFSLGRLVIYKGYEYLIEAANYLGDDFVVLIGGAGNQYQNLQSLIYEKGLQDKVHLLGFIPDEQLGSYFDACHLFCLTSIDKREAFAIVQAKAMFHGRPVVSTNIPESGVSWVNKHGFSGLNVPPRDSRAVASAIEEISSDEAVYNRYCYQSRQRYEELFRMNQMISEHKKLYDKLIINEKTT
jgi:rhamnosyl/mannosyltransferase